MKLSDLQVQAEELGIDILTKAGKEKAAKTLKVQIAKKQAQIEESLKEPLENIEIESTEVKPKKKYKNVSVLDKAHFDTMVKGGSKLYPFSSETLPFDMKDVAKVKDKDGNVVVICLTSLRNQMALAKISRFLNNKGAVTVNDAAQVIANCIVSAK